MSSSIVLRVGPLNGLWVASQRLFSMSHWYIGKLWTQNRQHVRVGQPELSAEIHTQSPEDVLGHDVRVRDDEHEVAWVRACRLRDRLRAPLPEQLGDRRRDATSRLDGDRHQPSRTEAPRQLRQLVDPRAGRAGQTGCRKADDAPPGGDGLSKTRKPRARSQRAEVAELHGEADIGLVGPEAVDGFAVGEARKGRREEGPIGHDGSCDLDGHGLDETHHVFLVDEAHLEVELRELGPAIGAQVLVAEAVCDLEVAVDAADHEQLLELLRACGSA